jgi:Vitamin K epoxide reductase family.
VKILSHQLTTVSVLEAITPVAAFIGTVLSYISSMELCTSSCAEAHLWRFFGFPFDLLGLIFFPTLLALSLLEKRSSQFSILASWMLAGAFGSELVFIYIQKAIIQQWCPVCLSIAASVVLAIGARILLFKLDFDKVLQQGSAKMVKPLFLKVVSNFLFVIAGASIALMGAAKPETSFAEGVGEEKADPVFGNKDSEVEVYIVTDWFCPACLKVAPILDTAYPEIMKQARLMFIDRNIHSESLNFVPYNLSFMLNNKPEYFKIRHVLEELAQKTKNQPLNKFKRLWHP